MILRWGRQVLQKHNNNSSSKIVPMGKKEKTLAWYEQTDLLLLRSNIFVHNKQKIYIISNIFYFIIFSAGFGNASANFEEEEDRRLLSVLEITLRSLGTFISHRFNDVAGIQMEYEHLWLITWTIWRVLTEALNITHCSKIGQCVHSLRTYASADDRRRNIVGTSDQKKIILLLWSA